ncbi:iron dicitrate transport regulator FecR [Alicyclobacillus mali]|uniref:protein acetyllysine N-acetyltransferase n=1 Tax=Alicyclobacillus mali (ex Roth et al. 2021) TaxID=1123961 RepID=A0ABS0F5S3_9BACL|nr:Sir2 family NAD-dependent protein deacetylase [Alicyclobacillus mali (ex Roth et al. 2021)]MBF8378655.1 iron dicitrate transport regulator FecR [Alicyclobacillus mali (ex Roth et al. 2021)]MCL6487478.1 iron dicitrate transport regulator FecR [Alicyclobacillus mali (ex Roth et al. 2021)]
MLYYCSGSPSAKRGDRHLWTWPNSHLVAITGAGISVESGLPTVDDVVAGVSLRRLFQPRIWREQPLEAFRAFRFLAREWPQKRPNRAHLALARAEIPIITQNIDGLHRAAGSTRIIELHGNLRELKCEACEGIFGCELAWREDIPRCPTCGHILRPGFVLEGEEVRHIARAYDWVAEAKGLLVVGTELEMIPVRQLYEVAKRRNVPIAWVRDHAEDWVPHLLGQDRDADSLFCPGEV